MVAGRGLMTDGKSSEISTAADMEEAIGINANGSQSSNRQKLLNKEAEKRKKRAQQFGAITSTAGNSPDFYDFPKDPSTSTALPSGIQSNDAQKKQDLLIYSSKGKEKAPEKPEIASETGKSSNSTHEVIDQTKTTVILPTTTTAKNTKSEDKIGSSSSMASGAHVKPSDIVLESESIQDLTVVEEKLRKADVPKAFEEIAQKEAALKPDVSASGSTDQIDNKKSTWIDDLIFKPAPKGKKIQCKIVRQKNGLGLDGLYPKYDLYLESNIDEDPVEFLLYARKRKKSKNSNYFISNSYLAHENNKEKEGFVGKVRSNFIGTSFSIFDNGYNPSKGTTKDPLRPKPRQELVSVLYETNILGFKGPRKMTVVLPSLGKDGRRNSSSEGDLQSKYKKGDTSEILVLGNKSPQWNEETQSYVLNFNGRVTMASVKNFQIVNANDLDYIILQFGKTGKDSFTMDYQYPLSALQAFGIVLSSFDAKLACE